MSESKPPAKRDFYAIITNATGAKVWLLEDKGRRVLPHWELEKAFNSSAVAQWLIQAVRGVCGLETVLLKECYFERIFENKEFQGTHRVFVLEQQGDSAEPDGAGGWYGRVEIDGLPFAVPLHAELVRKWLTENTVGPISPLRAAWANPGWFARTSEWITDFVAKQGWELTGPVEQRKADVISCQLKIPTSAGNLYLKGVPPYFRYEPVFGQVLEKYLPGRVPHILATDSEAGRILMADFNGEAVAELPDFAIWQEAVREYARLQIAGVPYVQELLEAGARDRRLSKLGGQVAEVFSRDDLWLVGQPMGLSGEEVKRLRAAIPGLQASCVELAAFGLPETLDSGDFHPHNVAVTANDFVFYDWSDLSITHPFLSLNPFAEYSGSFKDKADYWEGLVAAYLEPWQEFLPRPELERAYRLAYKLGSATQVLNYAWIHDNVEPDNYPNVDGGLIYYARLLLESFKF